MSKAKKWPILAKFGRTKNNGLNLHLRIQLVACCTNFLFASLSAFLLGCCMFPFFSTFINASIAIAFAGTDSPMNTVRYMYIFSCSNFLFIWGTERWMIVQLQTYEDGLPSFIAMLYDEPAVALYFASVIPQMRRDSICTFCTTEWGGVFCTYKCTVF